MNSRLCRPSRFLDDGVRRGSLFAIRGLGIKDVPKPRFGGLAVDSCIFTFTDLLDLLGSDRGAAMPAALRSFRA